MNLIVCVCLVVWRGGWQENKYTENLNKKWKVWMIGSSSGPDLNIVLVLFFHKDIHTHVEIHRNPPPNVHYTVIMYSVFSCLCVSPRWQSNNVMGHNLACWLTDYWVIAAIGGLLSKHSDTNTDTYTQTWHTYAFVTARQDTTFHFTGSFLYHSVVC